MRFVFVILLLIIAVPASAQSTMDEWIATSQQQSSAGNFADAAISMSHAQELYEADGGTDPFFLADLVYYRALFFYRAGDRATALEILDGVGRFDPPLLNRLPEFDMIRAFAYEELGAFGSAGTSFQSAATWMGMGSWSDRFTTSQTATIQLRGLHASARASFFVTEENNLLPLVEQLEIVEQSTGLPFYLGRLMRLNVVEYLGRALEARDGYLDLALQAPSDVSARALKAAALIDWRLGAPGTAAKSARDALDIVGLPRSDAIVMEALLFLAERGTELTDGDAARVLEWATDLGAMIGQEGVKLNEPMGALLELIYLLFDLVETLPDEAIHISPNQFDADFLREDVFFDDAYLQRLQYDIRLRLATFYERSGYPEAARENYMAVWRWPNAHGPESARALSGLGRVGMVVEGEIRRDAALSSSFFRDAFGTAEYALRSLPARQSDRLKRQIADYTAIMEQAIDAGFEALEASPPIRPCDASGCRQSSTFFFPWLAGTFDGYVGLDQGGSYPDQLETAFRQIQTVRHSEAGRAIAAMTERLSTGDTALAELLRRRDGLITARAVADAAGLSGRAEVLQLDAEIDTIEATLQADYPDYSSQAAMEPLTLEQARTLLQPDEALVMYLATARGLHVFAITTDAVVWHRADITRDWLRETVDRLRQQLDPTQTVRGSFSMTPEVEETPAFDLSLAHQLHGVVLGGVVQHLPQDGTLLIAPDDVLQTLPYGVLVSQPVADATPHAEVPWAIRDHAFATLPVAASLKSLRQDAGRSTGAVPFLGVGNPRFDAQAHLVDLAPLPETADELRQLDRSIAGGDGLLLLDDQASIPALSQAQPSDARVIAFATHGLLGGEVEGLGEPALALTPNADGQGGYLLASEIAQLSLDADWVILSACNTAAGPTTDSTEGLSGLARAFFYAGARKLLVSHWPVQSDATVALTTTMFATLAEEDGTGADGVRSARALRRAMLSMIETPGTPRWQHPSAWAPFVVAGG
ncbi:MAG: CHAT domain-containing protein [Paracoccaceae bacterium]